MVLRTVVRLAPVVDHEALNEKLDAFSRRHLGEKIGLPETYRLLALPRMHLYARHDFNIDPTGTPGQEPFGDIYRCYAFALIGISILGLACINYVNLATARALQRSLEVGVRKVSGARRSQLIRQFLGEAVVLCAVAAATAIGLTHLLLPATNNLLSSDLLIDGSTYAIGAGMAVFVGILAGLYPAVVLSSFQPVRVLKGPGQTSKGRTALRQVLVVFQFAVSVVLIISTLVAHQQTAFIRNKDLGFMHEGRIIMPVLKQDKSLRKRFLNVRARFQEVPDVIDAALSQFPPGMENDVDRVFIKKPGALDSTNVYWLGIDERFTDVYDIEILRGRSI